MPAQIFLSQAGKPVGTVGVARDDFALGVPVVAQVQGGPFIAQQWSFISKAIDVVTPATSAAAFSAPSGSSTNVTPIDLRGTYLIQCAVDSGQGLGATEDDIARIAFYAGPALNANPAQTPRRHPAFGERREFNAVDALFPGGNPIGWAYEMEKWFTVIENIISGGGTGDMVGPAASLDNEMMLFDGITGKLAKQGGIIVSPVAKTIDFAQGVALVAPAILTPQNNWVPNFGMYAGDWVVDMRSTGPQSITGIVAPSDPTPLFRFFYNGNTTPGDDFTFVHDATSTAANRFLNSTGANLVIPTGTGVLGFYNPHKARWCIQAPGSSSIPTNTPTFLTPEVRTVSVGAVLADIGKALSFDHAATPMTYTFPSNATVPIPVGTILYFEQGDAAALTIAAGAGATLQVPATFALTMRERFSKGSAQKISTNGWRASGDFRLAP